MINRMEQIKKKGFQMIPNQSESKTIDFDNYEPIDYSKIKVGTKTLEDAIFDNLGDFKKVNSNLGDKETVLRAINNKDYAQMREISNFFYETSGIYSRLCRYMAYLYRYDWLVTPYVIDEQMDTNKLLNNFSQVLSFFDSFGIKKKLGEIALTVVRNGCFYGYIVNNGKAVSIQELPAGYCRSKFSVNDMPVIEFNMKFFDDYFKTTEEKIKVLKLFPSEFLKGYELYKRGKLKSDDPRDRSAGWFVLEPENGIKFNLNGEDFPAFISVIPAIIDLADAQALDRKKMMQKLLKIIIQKMPMDKNGELIFDIDEAAALHNNAVAMLQRAVGVDVLTTFADVQVADMSDKGTTTSVDELAKVERAVYNEAGVSQMQFNTDGNLALEKSMLNDEASMSNLITQFENLLNRLLKPFNTKPKKFYFKIQILMTTWNNYKEMSKMYKEHTQLGYSKMLPQIALGQSQSSILANAYFENKILNLSEIFIPPMMSSTMSSKSVKADVEDKKVGRKEKPDEEKTEKTIANRESMS